MQTKLQELTDKIYQEGVQKAREEAEELLVKARKEASEIIEEARREAQRIVDESDRKASENARNVESEIRLASGQAMSALKQSIAQLVTLKVVSPGISALFSNVDFLSALLLKIVGSFAKEGNFDMKVLLSEADHKQMDEFIKNSFAHELNQGLVVEADQRVKGGFKIGPKDGSYLVSFTEEDFKNFFKTYVRAKSSELLFEN